MKLLLLFANSGVFPFGSGFGPPESGIKSLPIRIQTHDFVVGFELNVLHQFLQVKDSDSLLEPVIAVIVKPICISRFRGRPLSFRRRLITPLP